MKKVIVFMLGLILVTGCSCGNTNLVKKTPTKTVENFFKNYQTLDISVIKQLDEVVDKKTEFTEEQKKEYKELMKKHYKELTYEVKDEVIDGDNATVTVEIEVTDYSKIMTDADTYLSQNPNEFNNSEGVYDVTLFTNYRLEKLKEAKDKVKYTLNLTLTKVNDEWMLDTLSDTDESKIHGTYVY